MLGLDISWGAWALASAVLLAGTVVQGCIGFGGNLLAVPLIVLFEAELVPGAMLVPAFFLSCLVLIREPGQADWRGAMTAVAGRVPGAALGALVLTIISSNALSVVFGLLILAAVLLTAWSTSVARNPATLFGVGLVAGFMATTVAVGGPPIALVYQNDEGPMVRTTLAVFLAVGTVVSVVALAIAGEFGSSDLAMGATLLPATLAGLIISGPLRSRVDGGRTKSAVLVLSAAAAIIAIVRGLG